MKMRGIKALLWVLNIVLVVGITMTGWMFVNSDPSLAKTRVNALDVDLSSLEAKIDKRHEKKDETNRRQKDMESLFKSNLRDNAPEPPAIVETAAETAVEAPKPKTPLDTYLSVTGIFGQVVLLDLKKKIGPNPAGQLDVLIGTLIPGMSPKTKPIRYEREPFPGAIVFEFGNEEIRMELEKDKTGVASSKSGSKGASVANLSGRKKSNSKRGGFIPGGARRATGRRPKLESFATEKTLAEGKEIRPGIWRLPRSEMDMIKEKGQDLLKSVNVQDYRDGKRTGLKVDFIEEGSFIADRGFRKGDIVIKVNNYKVKSQSDLISWVQNNQKSLENSVVVTVLRQGQEKTIQYQIQK